MAPVRLAAAGLCFALVACAGARPSGSAERPCEASWSHVHELLTRGLDQYLEGMRRYAAARDPELSMAETSVRTRARATEWETTHGPRFDSDCQTWPAERRRCVIEATVASDLNGCGLEPLVRSFTDEVLTDFETRPFDR